MEQFYCQYAFADGIWHIGIKEKALEFSSALLSTAYCLVYAGSLPEYRRSATAQRCLGSKRGIPADSRRL